MPRSRDGEALFQACGREGCPLCLVTLERMTRVMDFWQYEWASEMENRQVLMRSKGFCARHTWQLAQLPDVPAPFALAMVYRSLFPDLLADIERDLAQGARRSQRERFWSRLWRRKSQRHAPGEETFFRACPFCQRQAEIEQELAQELLAILPSAEFQARLREATGFCLPHFMHLLHVSQEEAQRNVLLTAQRACLQHTMEELDELVRKHDYRFLQEPRGEEMTSWRRAALLLVGNRGIR